LVAEEGRYVCNEGLIQSETPGTTGGVWEGGCFTVPWGMVRLRGLWGGKRQVCRGLLLHRMMLAGGTDDGKDVATGRG